MILGVSKDQEALLISLKRPIVFVQPSAFDKGMSFLKLNAINDESSVQYRHN